MSTATATRKVDSLVTTVFDAPGLGGRSYLLSDGAVGVVVDPQRDPSPYLSEALKLGISITVVLETHIHNDYVSGGLALARATGASYAIPAGEPVSFSEEALALDDGDTVLTGLLKITAVATAGHTDHHLAYCVSFTADDPGTGDQVVCTGGSLLANATGRTDLLGPALAEPLARSQWRSVRLLLTTLPKHTRILPTHGFGSFCSATPSLGELTAVSTIGRELEQNPAALLDEEEFVAMLGSEAMPVPSYYRHMAPLNRRGPIAPSFGPVRRLGVDGLGKAFSDDKWVVDLRQRRMFAAGHIHGTVNLELGANLTTYLGWILPWESDLVLLANDDDKIAEARRLIARIGRDDLSGAALWSTVGSTSDGTQPGDDPPLRSYPVVSFADLAQAWCKSGAPRPVVLDVRHRHEWKLGHISGAHHLPLTELAGRRQEVSTAGQVWVHCGAGFRAAVAASLLSGWGVSPVFVDDLWENATKTDLPIVTAGS
jgi:glyoxylase-like metal-dependent hydrolase (beta-lactamase superfamily II)/rhodanese-related sulfurtransferase